MIAKLVDVPLSCPRTSEVDTACCAAQTSTRSRDRTKTKSKLNFMRKRDKAKSLKVDVNGMPRKGFGTNSTADLSPFSLL